MKKSFIKPNATSTTIIGGSDGPTSVFLLGGHQKNSTSNKEYREQFFNCVRSGMHFG